MIADDLHVVLVCVVFSCHAAWNNKLDAQDV